MKFGFLKFDKRASLFIGGFFIVLFFASLTFWFYENFLISQDQFLNSAPSAAMLYWHKSPEDEIDLSWLYDLSGQMLLGEANEQAKFLFDKVAEKSQEISFAILPGFEDFIFWSSLDAKKFNIIKDELEKREFNYIFENEGRITIANTKSALRSFLGVISQKSQSLADQKSKRIAFGRANLRSPVQIYFQNDFQWKNFELINFQSDFWAVNKLIVVPKMENAASTGLNSYCYLVIIDNPKIGQKIEQILKNNLAVILPQKKEKILEDKSVVWEIIADPDIFHFEKDKIEKNEISYLVLPEFNAEIAFSRINDLTILSNSQELLKNYLLDPGLQKKYYGKNIIDLFLDLAKWLTDDFDGMVFGVDLR